MGNKKLVRYFLEAVNSKEQPGGPIHYPFSLFGFGNEPFLRQQLLRQENAFPGYQLMAEELVAEEDCVFVQGTFQGKHLGEWYGLVPTGIEVTVPFAMGFRIQDRAFRSCWLQVDHLALLQSLGTLPTFEHSDYEVSIYFEHDSHPVAEHVFSEVTALGFTVREYDLWRNAREDGDPSLTSIAEENTLHYAPEAVGQAESICAQLKILEPPIMLNLKAGHVESIGWSLGGPRRILVFIVTPEAG